MKKNFFINLGFLSAAMLLTMGSRGQDTIFKTLPSVTITPATQVSKAVNESFRQSFPDATKTVWYTQDKNYLVRFMTIDQSNRALYKKNGMLVYHLRYGQEKNLPDDVRKMVRSGYLDYAISGVLCVHQDEREIWVINLEDSTKLIIVRVEQGEMEQVETLNKS